MTIAPPILSSKLFAPKVRGRLITRTRLIDQLDLDQDQSLVIVCAPPGYGKSTAVAQWISLLDCPSVWLTVERSDRDVRTFLTLIVEGIKRIDESFFFETAALLEGGNFSYEAILQSLLEDLSLLSRPVVLVVDDFHSIESPKVDAVIARLLEHVTWQFRLVLITRKPPNLPVARLRASGEVLELGISDLRFDPDETEQFLRSRGHSFSESEREILLQKTEGWIAALNLTSLAIKGLPAGENEESSFTLQASRLPYLGNYLWQEVIDNIPGELQDFLFRVSLLDRFTVDLANAVLRIDKAAQWIKVCEEESLFISTIDAFHTWYRFHPLFLDVLHDNLEQRYPRAEIHKLHARASRWFQSHGFILPAVQHAIASDDRDRVIAMLEDVCTTEFEADRIVELLAWLSDIPHSVLGRSPRLAFYLAWAQIRLGLWKEADISIALAETADAVSPEIQAAGSISLWKGLRATVQGDYPEAVVQYRIALQQIGPEQRTENALASVGLGMALSYAGEARAAHDVFSQVRLNSRRYEQPWLRQMESVHSGYTLLLQGELQSASEVIGRAIDSVHERSTQLWIVPAMVYLGMIALEQNCLEESEAYLADALRRSLVAQTVIWRPKLYMALAALRRAQGRFEEAKLQVQQAVDAATANKMDAALSDARALEAEIYLAVRRQPLVQRWVDSTEFELDETPPFERQAEHLVFARYLIASGRSGEAIPILERMRGDSQNAGRRGALVEIGVISALALKDLGDSAGAIARLQDALTLAAELGFLQVFLKDWGSIAPLLRNIAAREHDRGYAAKLLALTDGQLVPAGADLPGMVEEVSRREVEVLALVVVGMSNREIGDRLFISERTVKKHVSNIMAKLGTSNRTQAADLARHLGIV